MKKLRNFIIYSTVYHMRHLDNGLENPSKSSFLSIQKRLCIFKIKFNSSGICEKCEHEKVAVFQYLSNGISYAQFHIIVEKLEVKSLRRNKMGSSSTSVKKIKYVIPDSSTMCPGKFKSVLRILFCNWLQNSAGIYIYTQRSAI